MKDVLVGRLQVGDVAHHLLLAGGHGRPQVGDVAHHLLLGGGELVHALPHRGETGRHRLELRHFGRKRGGRGRRDRVGSGLRKGCGLRCQPANARLVVAIGCKADMPATRS